MNPLLILILLFSSLGTSAGVGGYGGGSRLSSNIELYKAVNVCDWNSAEPSCLKITYGIWPQTLEEPESCFIGIGNRYARTHCELLNSPAANIVRYIQLYFRAMDSGPSDGNLQY
jgi:hypothetical protein